MKYLLCWDHSDHSKKAVKYLGKTARPEDEVIICTFFAEASISWKALLPGGSSQFFNHTEDDMNRQNSKLKHNALEALEEPKSQLVELGLNKENITLMAEAGDAREGIVDLANDEEVDSIIIGSRGHGKIGKVMLGSVSNYVSHHAEQPVVIVR